MMLVYLPYMDQVYHGYSVIYDVSTFPIYIGTNLAEAAIELIEIIKTKFK